MPKLAIIAATAVASGLFGALAIVAPEPMPSTSSLIGAAAVAHAASLGLTSETLAAAGLSGQQATTLLGAIAESDTLTVDLTNAETAASSAGAALTAAQEALRSSAGTEGEPEAVATAQAAFDQALAACATARTALFNAATAGLSSETKAKLAALSTGLVHNVPREFTVLTMSPEQWVSVEAALRAERRATRLSTTLAEEHATLLSSIRTNENVAAALTNLNNGLGAVETAFATATATPEEP